jgi:cytochrome oxidase Cu insertion factor (SCO1/SenC/PrrC family)
VFLTGTPASVHQVAFSTFHLGDLITVMNHSTRFALVDKNGYIRGYYDSNDPKELKTLVKDATVLR